MADDKDDLSINEYNCNFTKELSLFIDIVNAMGSIHEAIFSRFPYVAPPAPKRIIGKLYDPDFEKKNPYFSDSRVMSAMMIDIATYGWDRFIRKYAEVNCLYTSYKRMTFLKACIACDMKNYFLQMVFFCRLLFWRSKLEEEELKQKEQKRKDMEESGND